MAIKGALSNSNDALMVSVNWNELHNGEEVYLLSSGKYMGLFKIISSREYVLLDKETNSRFHYLGVLHQKRK